MSCIHALHCPLSIFLLLQVTKIEEEEYCLIPMGGVLPKHPQRVIAVGGSAGMVHPSTGFMMARMLGIAPTVGAMFKEEHIDQICLLNSDGSNVAPSQVADAIVEQLSKPADRANAAGAPRRPASEAEATAMATAVWAATWPVERVRQR